MKKSKIVSGSSNLQRHFGRTEQSRGFCILKCTNLEIFRVRLASLEEEDECVVISVIENMICDEVKLVNQESSEDLGNAIVRAIMIFIRATYNARLPECLLHHYVARWHCYFYMHIYLQIFDWLYLPQFILD